MKFRRVTVAALLAAPALPAQPSSRRSTLGAFFVVSADLSRMLAPGERVGLSLAGHGVSVVAA